MIRVGKIVATHGLNGALILTHIVGKSTWLKKDSAIHVEMQKGSYIPYFVVSEKAVSGEEYIVTVEDIDKVEIAKRLVGKQVYVDEVLLSSFAKNSPLLWIGFSIMDKSKGKIGEVEDVMQTGNQWIAKTTYSGSEALIPLVPEMIEQVDIKKRLIAVNLPEGLLDVYIS